MNNCFETMYTRVGEEKTYMRSTYLKYEKEIKNFEVKDSDIFVVSYPKTGTTWTQEMVWLIANNLDFDGAKINLERRFPYLEMSAIIQMDNIYSVPKDQRPDFMENSIEFTKKMKSPRFIKSHLPFSLLPDDICNNIKTPKLIYVMRNPKDTCISNYNFSVLLGITKMNLEEFCTLFLEEKVTYSPFWKHIFGFWRRKSMPNLLIITYEDMKRDLPSVIRKVASFLNKTMTDKQTEQLCAHLSFESMKQNPAVNLVETVEFLKQNNITEGKGHFMPSGVVGKYKEELSPEIIHKFDEWTKQYVEGTSFPEEYPDMVM